MATRRYKINPGETNVDGNEITEEVGAATNSKNIELTVDLAASYVYDGSGVLRAVTKQEVLDALDQLKEHIAHRPWPPA